MTFGILTAICGLSEILSQLFLDGIPRILNQGETGRQVHNKSLIIDISRALLWVGIRCHCDSGVQLLPAGASQLPPPQHH